MYKSGSKMCNFWATEKFQIKMFMYNQFPDEWTWKEGGGGEIASDYYTVQTHISTNFNYKPSFPPWDCGGL